MLAQQLSPGLFLLDHHYRDKPGTIASYLLAGDGQLALIETGAASTLDNLLAGIREAGYEPSHLTHLFLTHIHLDHAGAAGHLVRLAPAARVYVHPVGAPHLTDPSRLLSSARRLWGEMMETLWGDMLPIPADRIQPLNDSAIIPVAGRKLQALDTPGHARHHLCYWDDRDGNLWTGDVGGVRVPGVDYIRPPTPPPDFDLEAWRQTIARLRTLRPITLYPTHFGGYRDCQRHLDELENRLVHWGDCFLQGLRAGRSPDEIAREIVDQETPIIASRVVDPADIERLDTAANYNLLIGGYVRYWQKKYPELVG